MTIDMWRTLLYVPLDFEGGRTKTDVVVLEMEGTVQGVVGHLLTAKAADISTASQGGSETPNTFSCQHIHFMGLR